MNEVWKDIKGYESTYQVSTLGRVRAINRIVTYSNGIRHHYKGHILTYWIPHQGKGYKNVRLALNGSTKAFAIHRLVAKAFIPNPNHYPEVNHKDENKLNNCTNNLEWCTASQNINYGTRNQRVIAKERNDKRSKPVIQMDLTGHIVKRWSSLHEAARYGYYRQCIVNCCIGKLHTHHGYKWQFTKEDDS